MANDVYAITHTGLTELVSARAATIVLDKALQKGGRTPDTVSRADMKALLTGPVIDELEHILPRKGVARSLKQIYALIPKPSGVKPEAEVKREETTNAPDKKGSSSSAGSGANSSGIEPSNKALSEAARMRPETSGAVAEVVASPAVATQPRRSLYIDDVLALEPVILAFARLDHVRLVAGLTTSGDIVEVRGDVEDAATLARYGGVALKLLGRSGTIRSYYLAHSASQLFLFPLGAYTVMVIGTVELNLGEVFSTLSTLEEDV